MSPGLSRDFVKHQKKKFPSNPILKRIFILWIQTIPLFLMCFFFLFKALYPFLSLFFGNNHFLYYRQAFGKEKSYPSVRFVLLSYKCLVILNGLYLEFPFEVETVIFKVNNNILNFLNWVGNNQRKLNAIHK